MSAIFYPMLILPIIVMIIFAFVFQDTLTGLTASQQRITCPWPALSGLWNASGTLQYSNGTYNYPNVSNQTLTLTCTNVHTLDTVDYYYGSPAANAVGALFYLGDVFSSFFDRVAAFFEMVALFFILPSEITGIPWFTYAQFVLVALPVIAIVMIIRGNT